LGKSLGGLGIIGVHIWVGVSGKIIELSGVKMSQSPGCCGALKRPQHILLELSMRAVWLELENFIVVYRNVIKKEARVRKE
jgi:hypothetical protein